MKAYHVHLIRTFFRFEWIALHSSLCLYAVMHTSTIGSLSYTWDVGILTAHLLCSRLNIPTSKSRWIKQAQLAILYSLTWMCYSLNYSCGQINTRSTADDRAKSPFPRAQSRTGVFRLYMRSIFRDTQEVGEWIHSQHRSISFTSCRLNSKKNSFQRCNINMYLLFQAVSWQ